MKILNLVPIISLLVGLTSCETCLTNRVFPQRGNNVYQMLEPCEPPREKNEAKDLNGSEILKDGDVSVDPYFYGVGYLNSFNATFLASGESYKNSQEAAECAEYIKQESKRQDTIKEMGK
jgi:hypothetical protein